MIWQLEPVLGVWTFLVGLAIGSFLNVVIYRIPRGYLLTLPRRSVCTTCQRQLTWAENIPVLSYIFLRGCCRGCGNRISLRYPTVEILCGALFFAVYRVFGFSPSLIFYWVYVAGLLAVTFIDLDFQIIPDRISLGGIVIGILASPYIRELGLSSSILGALLGGGFFWAMGFLYEKIRGREGLGFGDVKLLAMIGAFQGPSGVLGTVILSSLVGSVVGVFLMIVQKKTLKTAIPYGPFLAIGALTTLFWGDFLAYQFYPQLR